MNGRSREVEILDRVDIPEDVRELCYRDLARTQRWLGNWRAVIGMLRRDPHPVRRVIDIGCGHGALVREMRDQLGVEAVGVDAQPPERTNGVRIVRADAVRDVLPAADVAVCLMMAHHLSEDDLRAMIHNVGRSCRRFVILDLVRSQVPSALFRTFVAPFVNPINAKDGVRSIERAFTAEEMRRIIGSTGVRFRHQVAPFNIRQIVDVEYS
jgi:2-polyprenyl-3-methyl-5-hydroxy-6-metoxy-1,4-benzoquinol methylase